jgi:8-amino-7-oxononanoate synthase
LESSEGRSEALDWIGDELRRLEAHDLRRRLVTHEGPQATRIVVDGRELLNFGSNDYLALASDRRLVTALLHAAQHEGWGAGASPLLTGHGASHRRLEERLAAFEATEAALVFPSGFAANVGTIAALVGPADAVYSDKLNHASIIDGCRLCGADVQVYPHARADELAKLLRSHTGDRRRLIVTDSLFSMEGDLAPLAELADLAERHDSMLMVDEAHATGVFGEHGRGVAEHLGVEHRVHVRIGTLSKALGCVGGFVAGSRELIDWIVNRARPYIFSTAGPPAASAAALAALEIVASEPHRGRELLARAGELRSRLVEQGWDVGASSSQIVPVIVGKPAAALQLSARLREQGIWAPAIRPPSVPHGRSLLRISLSYGHTPEMLDQLCRALAEVQHA